MFTFTFPASLQTPRSSSSSTGQGKYTVNSCSTDLHRASQQASCQDHRKQGAGGGPLSCRVVAGATDRDPSFGAECTGLAVCLLHSWNPVTVGKCAGLSFSFSICEMETCPVEWSMMDKAMCSSRAPTLLDPGCVPFTFLKILELTHRVDSTFRHQHQEKRPPKALGSVCLYTIQGTRSSGDSQATLVNLRS